MLARFHQAVVSAGLVAGVASAQQIDRLGAGVWTVGVGVGADFADLESAIDAAGEGDLLLIQTDLSTSAIAVIDGKSLVLAGDGERRTLMRSADLASESPIQVRNLGAGQSVVFRNLEFRRFSHGLPTLLLEDNLGAVWFEDVAAAGELRETQVIQADSCATVVLVRADFGMEGEVGIPLANGVVSANSSGLHVFESVIHGFDTQHDFLGDHRGSDAIALTDSFLFVSGSDLRGGRGGDCYYVNEFLCFGAGPGGDGIDARGTSEIHFVDSTVGGADGGGDGNCGGRPCAGVAPPGDPYRLLDASTIELLPEPARTYELSSPARAGGTAVLRAGGSPDDLVFSLIGVEPTGAYLATYAGTQLVASPFEMVAEGTIPAGGVLTKSVPIPRVPAAIGFALAFRQGLFLDVDGPAYLSSGSALVIVRRESLEAGDRVER